MSFLVRQQWHLQKSNIGMANFRSHFRYVQCKISSKINESISMCLFVDDMNCYWNLYKYICLFSYRLKPNLNRIFGCSNKLRRIHLMILIAFICRFFFDYLLWTNIQTSSLNHHHLKALDCRWFIIFSSRLLLVSIYE